MPQWFRAFLMVHRSTKNGVSRCVPDGYVTSSSYTTLTSRPKVLLPLQQVSSRRPIAVNCKRAAQHSGDSESDSRNRDVSEHQTQGQPLHKFASSIRRGVSADLFDAERDNTVDHPQVSQDDKHVDVYNHTPSVNLSSCMQSQVPQPYGKGPTHMNMPGGVNRREDKYLQGHLQELANRREFSTSCSLSISTDPRSHPSTTTVDEHGNVTYTSAVRGVLSSPCPQGVQGEDCAQFKLWLSNCLMQGHQEACEKLANEYIAGRKTLAQVFADFDVQIRSVSAHSSKSAFLGEVGSVPALSHSLMATQVEGKGGEVHDVGGQPPVGSPEPQRPLTRAEKLKRAVKDYGSTVIVFHVGISLISLGGFYLLVASNVDVESILAYFNLNFGKSAGAVETASTFAAAYAVHKLFAPVRIAITLTCTPIIVRSLRARGILKSPKV